MFQVPEKYRIAEGQMGSDASFGNNGCFALPSTIGNRVLMVIASDGMGWEHVSIHARQGRQAMIPAWNEMCYVKNLFWDEQDVVMQLHPAKSEYVNNHAHVLHLWRPTDTAIPTPPSILVGFKGIEAGSNRQPSAGD